MKFRIGLFLTLLYCTLWSLHAQEQVTAVPGDSIQFSNFHNPDSLHISFLTCSGGPEVYALYGHFAIRVQNENNGDDWVFNYGTFNMADPAFIPKFTLGWMDYELGVAPFDRFYMHYTNDGCSITQQELNLTSEEEARMFRVLLVNYEPENRGYRYNFLYDNCATRPRDILESVVNGKLVWQSDSVAVTYRQMMHACNDRWPWSRLGVDLCLGADADKVITMRQQEFLPAYLQDHLNHAVIQDSLGHTRPVVKSQLVLDAVHPMDQTPEFFLTPMQCVLILLGLALALCIYEFVTRRLWWGVDVVTFLAQGLAGVIVFILFFFSEHPTVDTNWLLWVFNPLPLLYLPVMIYKRTKHRADKYQLLKLGWLAAYLVAFAFIPQDMPMEVWVVALILCLRAASAVRYDRWILKTTD